MVTWANVWHGEVQNVGAWDGKAKPAPSDAYMVEVPDGLDVQVGWLYDGATFTPPTPQE